VRAHLSFLRRSQPEGDDAGDRSRRDASFVANRDNFLAVGIAAVDNAAMRLIVSAEAARAMQPKSMPRRDAAALLRKLREFAENPFAGHSWAEPLKAQPGMVRVRQGNWRAVCRIDRGSEAVLVDAVAHRREVYR
jgi:mRNA interferase RelE/StbE